MVVGFWFSHKSYPSWGLRRLTIDILIYRYLKYQYIYIVTVLDVCSFRKEVWSLFSHVLEGLMMGGEWERRQVVIIKYLLAFDSLHLVFVFFFSFEKFTFLNDSISYHFLVVSLVIYKLCRVGFYYLLPF